MSGENTEQVNAQFLTLKNITDGETYDQITNLMFDLSLQSYFKPLMDGTMQRLYGTPNNVLDFDITLTVPEVPKWLLLATYIDLFTNRTLRIKNYEIEGTAEDGTKFKLTFNGAVVAFRTVRPRVSAATHHLRIDATDILVGQ